MPVLALCVKMQYTLSRWRFLNPHPPYEVAGVLTRLGDRLFLADAQGAVELCGVSALEARSGDWVVVTVDEPQPFLDRLMVVQCRLLSRQLSEWNPAVGREARAFSAFVEDIRQHFLARGLHQVLTPGLVVCPGLEPSLEPLQTLRRQGSRADAVFLPTSPEIHLKKALALGWTDIFEIKNCYRNNENSAHHAAEFLMLEWYRACADLDLVIQDLRELWRTLGARGWLGDLTEPQVTDFATLFHEILEFRLTPSTSRQEVALLCEKRQIVFGKDETFGDLFHRLMMDVIEPAIAQRGPLIVRRFPPSMAALARLDKDGWADRFELYWNGFEIANAFFEVTDPDEQAGRWEIEKAERRRLGTSEVPDDPELIAALRRGVPPTGGIALGLERLFMAARGVDDIRELRLFR